jgi:hypothetical protein
MNERMSKSSKRKTSFESAGLMTKNSVCSAALRKALMLLGCRIALVHAFVRSASICLCQPSAPPLVVYGDMTGTSRRARERVGGYIEVVMIRSFPEVNIKAR